MVEKTKRPGERARSQVPAEGNFEEHPYFRVGDRNAGTGIHTYENELRTKDGNVLHQVWTVRAAHGRGLPGRFDQDVYVALLQMIDRKGLPEDRWLSFSLYELVESMGRGHSGRDYRQVRDSLMRLATTTIESDNAFYHRGRKTFVQEVFSLIKEVRLAEYEGVDGERTDRNRVHLSELFVDSYRSGYLKNIDVRFYWSLSSPVAKRLYRLIDKKRNGRRSWEAELFSLRDRIPLSDYRFASKIKEKLAPAHKELVDKEFLEEVGYRKGDGGGEFATYKIAESFHSRRSAVSLDGTTADELFAIQRLRAEGMDGATAEDLVAGKGPARVMYYVEALPYRKGVRNRAGWLRRAISEGWELDVPPVDAPSPFGSGPAAASAGAPEYATDDATAAVAREGGISPQPGPGADPALAELWASVLGEVSLGLEDASLGVWLEGAVPSALEGETLTVCVPNAFAREYVEGRLGAPIEAALKGRLSEGAALRITVAGEEPRLGRPGRG